MNSAPQALWAVAPQPYHAAVTIACRYSTAHQVSVAGAFNGWSTTATPLREVGGGLWSVRLDLPPGRHPYRLIVDGQWLSDPHADAAVPNPYGDLDSVLIVPEPAWPRSDELG